MTVAELLKWQWQDYGRYHQHKTSLLIHIFAVPLFLAGTVLIVAAAITLSLVFLMAGVAGIGISLALQGRAHKFEPVPSVHFSSVGNAVSRLFLEQWITFPRFVLSGGWFRNLRQSGKN